MTNKQFINRHYIRVEEQKHKKIRSFKFALVTLNMTLFNVRLHESGAYT
jgi:hypothetical protein